MYNSPLTVARFNSPANDNEDEYTSTNIFIYHIDNYYTRKFPIRCYCLFQIFLLTAVTI